MRRGGESDSKRKTMKEGAERKREKWGKRHRENERVKEKEFGGGGGEIVAERG